MNCKLMYPDEVQDSMWFYKMRWNALVKEHYLTADYQPRKTTKYKARNVVQCTNAVNVLSSLPLRMPRYWWIRHRDNTSTSWGATTEKYVDKHLSVSYKMRTKRRWSERRTGTRIRRNMTTKVDIKGIDLWKNDCWTGSNNEMRIFTTQYLSHSTKGNIIITLHWSNLPDF